MHDKGLVYSIEIERKITKNLYNLIVKEKNIYNNIIKLLFLWHKEYP